MVVSAVFKKKNPSFEEGWPVLEEIINELITKIDGVRPVLYTPEQFMNGYWLVYSMCGFNLPAARVPEKLYEHYQNIHEDYVSSKVMPLLREKNGEILLKELVQQWRKYKTLRTSLSKIFCYLNRFPLYEPPPLSLEETSNSVFYRLVYGEMNDQVRAAVISEINRERKGEEIDQEVVKNAVEIYMEMAEGSMKYYEEDFETAMLRDTAKFYSQKALEWRSMNTDSHDLYMLKVQDYMKEEGIRVANYLKPRILNKIFKVVEDEMLAVLAKGIRMDDTTD